MFHIYAIWNIYTYVVNQHTHTDKICFTIYEYSYTCLGHFATIIKVLHNNTDKIWEIIISVLL